MTLCGSNVYTNPNLEIISLSMNVPDLGIYMSGDCTFNYHISSLSKKCANLSGWILRTFYTRDCIPMLILFKSIVLSRLDYGTHLWSPFLIKHITQLEKIWTLLSAEKKRKVLHFLYLENYWRSIRLFNSLPMHLRSIYSCSVLRFKTQLDI